MNTQLTHRVVNYSTKETAAAMRKALKAAWPGVKFSVTMSRGTGHGWLHVNYVDGPLESEVRGLCYGFQSSQFSGMDDSYHSVDSTLYAEPDGSLVEYRFSCCGVNTSRDYSPEAEAWAKSVAVRGSHWWPDGLDAYLDNEYFSTRGLLAGTDLTAGFP
ncbi:MAG: LPD29 domain-containing protein, partial [Dermatophilaceae bacterium]